MITFGLTGGICCGKSTVSKTFLAADIPLVDADIVARQVVEPGTYGHLQIALIFGDEYINDDKTINRTKLGNLVFSDEKAMNTLNNLMAPLIQKEAQAQLKNLHNNGHIVVGYDAALICEMGNAKNYRPLIVVHCPRVTQIERLMKRNGLTESEACARIDAQMPTEKKMALADYLIDTSGTIEYSIQQTKKIIDIFKG